MVEAGTNGNAFTKKNPTTAFSSNILQSIVGPDKALKAFQSISMGGLPNMNQAQAEVDSGALIGAQSMGMIGKSFLQDDLVGVTAKYKAKVIKKNIGKETAPNADGLDKYLQEDDSDSDSGSDDSFEEQLGEDGNKNFADGSGDPSKLIDFELIKLLQYCKTLESHRETEDYQEDILLKSLDLGPKVEGKKLLIFDMDETLVAAKFEGHVPSKFEETFSFPYGGSKIFVRLRPYLVDCLEKLAQFYEIIVFTAGQQEYADNIMDYIDADRKMFSKRLYRQDCIQVD